MMRMLCACRKAACKKIENQRYENEIKREYNNRKYIPVEWAGTVAEGNPKMEYSL